MISPDHYTTMSSVPRYTPHYTASDYRDWQGDWELWSGVAVAMTPSPFGRHGSVVARFVNVLINGIDAVGCDASVIAEIDWIVTQDTVVRPDVSVVCGSPPERHIETAPAIIVEVLSAATRERDLNHKRILYENQGVAWYLIADPEDSSITILQLNEQQKYVPISVDERLELAICSECRFAIDLRRCFRR